MTSRPLGATGREPESDRSLATCSILLTGVLLAGCAQGSGGGESADVTYDADAELSGSLTVMAFGADDEIGSVRMEEAEAALGDVEVDLIEGDLDIEQFLSSVASGEPPEIVYADPNQIGTFASRGAILPLTDCSSASAASGTGRSS